MKIAVLFQASFVLKRTVRWSTNFANVLLFKVKFKSVCFIALWVINSISCSNFFCFCYIEVGGCQDYYYQGDPPPYRVEHG